MQNTAFFISTTGWGGLEMNVLKMALELNNLDFNISLITAKNSRLSKEASKKTFELIQIKTPKKYFDFKSAKNISQVLKKREITTVIIPDNRDLDVLSWTKRLHFRKLTLIYHQNMQIGINKKDLLHTWRFNAINWWVTPLKWLKKEVETNTNFPPSRIKIIPIGTEVSKFLDRVYSKKEARKKLKIDTDVRLIGIVGRISPKKGQGFVIKAIKELQKQNKQIELLIFGSATINDNDCKLYEKQIKEFVNNNNLTDIVHFREFSSEINLFYNAIDIFTIASESETYGMVTIEAMLSELPIIAANTGGSPEILNEGKLGRLYNFENIENYCQQVDWIINNSDNAKIMASNAKAKAIKEYSHLIETKRIAELIKHMK